jgi:hypothetical protein
MICPLTKMFLNNLQTLWVLQLGDSIFLEQGQQLTSRDYNLVFEQHHVDSSAPFHTFISQQARKRKKQKPPASP